MKKASQKLKDTKKALNKLKSKRDYQGLLTACQNALAVFPEDPYILKLLHYAQSHYVNEKLKSDLVKELEKKEEYETLIQVYYKLLSIFPESKLLQRLMKAAQKKNTAKHLKEQSSYLNEAASHIQDFIKQGELDEAMQATYQMISYAPSDKRFKKLLKKIQKKRSKIIEKELSEYFNHEIPLMKKEYSENKKGFIRV